MATNRKLHIHKREIKCAWEEREGKKVLAFLKLTEGKALEAMKNGYVTKDNIKEIDTIVVCSGNNTVEIPVDQRRSKFARVSETWNYSTPVFIPKTLVVHREYQRALAQRKKSANQSHLRVGL